MKYTPIAVAVASALALASCGGSPSAPTDPSGNQSPAVVVSGAFVGTATIQGEGSAPAIAAVSAGGSAFLLGAGGGGFWILPPFSSSGALSGALGYEPPAGQSDVGLSEPSMTISGAATGNPATAITATLSSGATNIAFSLPTLVAQSGALADFAGTYSGIDNSGIGAFVVVSATGEISGSTWDGQCVLSGTMSIGQVGAPLTVAVADNGAPNSSVCIGAANGLGFIAAPDLMSVNNLEQQGVPGPYLYLSFYNSTNAILLELAKQ